MTDGWGISCEIGLRWMPPDFTDDKSTLGQVMAWCRKATRHYLSQCWPRSLAPYGVTRPQWVKFSGWMSNFIRQQTRSVITYQCFKLSASFFLTLIVAWWRHRAIWIWINIISGNGWSPDGTKPLPELMNYRQWGYVAFTPGQFRVVLNLLLCITGLKIYF